MYLYFKNNVSKDEFSVEVKDTEKYCQAWNFDVELPTHTYDGEYTVRLYDDEDNEIWQGLVQVGETTKWNNIYYEKQDGYISFRQYQGGKNDIPK